jgi:phosphopantothenoylcysteine decarboxylase / phosphopantothenate---cysteine ligase
MNKNSLAGKKILITAGPTIEAIDTVQFVSSHSTGTAGYAMAEEFLQHGAEVVLISGPVCLTLKHSRLTLIDVKSASEMYMACCQYFESVDVAIFTAAVADFRPVRAAGRKISREESEYTVRMVRNIDIACEFGKVKTRGQLSVGFAHQRQDEFTHAMRKLHRKNFDLVILNCEDENKISVYKKDLSRTDHPAGPAKELARDIAFEIYLALSNAELAEWEEKDQAYEMMYS